MANLNKKLEATGIKFPAGLAKQSKLTREIMEALLEVKLIQKGKIKPLTIKDI